MMRDKKKKAALGAILLVLVVFAILIGLNHLYHFIMDKAMD